MVLTVNKEGEAELRAPLQLPDKVIEEFLAAHQEWLEKHLSAHRTYPDAELQTMRKAAKEWFPPRVAHYAALMGVSPAGVKITSARTRHGSCSPKGSLCFSLYLMEKSEKARDAVVVHELAHLKRRDHSPAFYAIVLNTLPDYYQRIKELKV